MACVVVISGAAHEISCDSREEVVVAHCGVVEQWEHEIESSLRPECPARGDGTVEFNHRRRVDLCEPIVEHRGQSVSAAVLARAWQAAIAAWSA